MDKYNEFWILSDLKPELIQAVIESLISLEYLHKTSWQYPLLWITETGKVAIEKDFLLKNDNKELQSFIKMMLWNKAVSRTKKFEIIVNKEPKDDTFDVTLKLIKEWNLPKEIAILRGLNLQTIEDHVVRLYGDSKLSLNEVLKYVNLWNLKTVKDVLNEEFNGNIAKLKPLKDKLPKNISYFDIKVALVMIKKRDL
jgi:hypothetical protein